MDYTALKNSLAVYMVVPVANANFLAALPTIIINAENRIYRECDFISTRSTQVQALSAGNRSLTLASFTNNGQSVTFKVIQSVNVVTPAATAPDAGTRIPLGRVSRDFLDFVWPTAAASTTVPSYFTMLSDTLLTVAPTPDAAYNLEITGTFRPASMGANAGAPANTYIGDNYPDLFFNACMVDAAGYQKNFGAAVDDPRMAMTWEAKYQGTLKTAIDEAYKQKGEGDAWTPYQPSPLAAPKRS